jgi:hypothetical protein
VAEDRVHDIVGCALGRQPSGHPCDGYRGT